MQRVADTDADKLIEAFKKVQFESPRSPLMIDPQTRDIIANIYIRRIEKVNGKLENVECFTFPGVKP